MGNDEWAPLGQAPRSGHSGLIHMCIHHWEGRPAGSPLQSRRADLDEVHDGANHVRFDLGLCPCRNADLGEAPRQGLVFLLNLTWQA
jgi:hypothetical protein